MGKTNVLIVDDEKLILDSYSSLLLKNGFIVDTANTGKDALEKVKSENYDLVLLDIVLNDMNGLSVLEYIKNQNTDTQIIMITGHSSIDYAIDALRKEASDYILKPCSSKELLFRVERVLERKMLKQKEKESEITEKILETIAALCHEVNNPLTGILGLSELLTTMDEKKLNNETVKSFSSKIHNAGEKISEVISRVRELKGIELKEYACGSNIIDITKSSEEIKPDPKNVIVVDDNPGVREPLRTMISYAGYTIDTAENGEQALDMFKKKNYSVAIIDICMPGIDGIELIRQMNTFYKDHSIQPPVAIIYTGYGDNEIYSACKELSVFAVLQKPGQFKNLIETVNKAEEFAFS